MIETILRKQLSELKQDRYKISDNTFYKMLIDYVKDQKDEYLKMLLETSRIEDVKYFQGIIHALDEIYEILSK